jgi:hypothetical protein
VQCTRKQFVTDTKLNIDNYALTLGGVPQTIIDTQNSMITSMLNNHSDLVSSVHYMYHLRERTDGSEKSCRQFDEAVYQIAAGVFGREHSSIKSRCN